MRLAVAAVHNRRVRPCGAAMRQPGYKPGRKENVMSKPLCSQCGEAWAVEETSYCSRCTVRPTMYLWNDERCGWQCDMRDMPDAAKIQEL